MSDNTRIGCPKCGNVIEFPVNIAGHVTNCPSCNESIQLQLPQTAPKLEPEPQYWVKPFMSVMEESDAAGVKRVGKQLQDLLNNASADGWEYVRKETLTIQVNPGCLGSLFTSGPTYANYEYIVFKWKGE